MQYLGNTLFANSLNQFLAIIPIPTFVTKFAVQTIFVVFVFDQSIRSCYHWNLFAIITQVSRHQRIHKDGLGTAGFCSLEKNFWLYLISFKEAKVLNLTINFYQFDSSRGNWALNYVRELRFVKRLTSTSASPKFLFKMFHYLDR